MLTQCLRIPHVSTGDMLREWIDEGNERGAAVAATLHSGALVSDDLVNRMVEERLSRDDARKGFVLDGYPRTLAQAEHLTRWLDERGTRELVIYLAVDYNVIIARLNGRRQCSRCGALYNRAFHPPKVDELCDLDGSKLVIRTDDGEQVIRERLEAYERQTRPVLAYYRGAGRHLFEVDGNDDAPDVIFQKIWRAMEKDDCSKDRR